MAADRMTRWGSRKFSRRDFLRLAGLTASAALAAACAPAAPLPTAAPPSAAEKAPAEETLHVGILDKEMTRSEIVDAIKKEGQVVIANWTYTANDTLVAKFKEHVKSEWGVDIKVIYEGTQAPSTYMTNVYTALKAGNPAPYDVMAIEENYYAEALQNDVADAFLPSDLIPNLDLVSDQFKHPPTGINFQATATPAIVYNSANVDFLQDWKDLADPRLKGRITMPLPGDITAGGFLLGICWSLGLDYKNPDDMTKAIDYAVDEIGPNVLKYTTDSSEMQQLLRSGAVDAVGFWNSLARMEFLSGYTDTRFVVAKSGMPMINGLMWIPKSAPHPILAQIFVNWRISPEAQVPPDSWGLEPGPWAELHEGFLGPEYEQYLPDWIKEDYYKFFPTSEEIQNVYKAVDWDYYAAHVDEWMDYYSKRLGL